jgi:hypothetical protein
MLYHVSTDISLEEKTFIPRIPKYRISGEDTFSKRICVSNSIQNCISSFPYKNDLMWNFRTRPVFLSVYEVNESTFSKEEIKYPEEIVDNVMDSIDNQEHWITKEFSAIPSLIKIKNLNFSRLCKYTNHYSGHVTEFEYEREIEDFDRLEKVMFYHNKHYREFLKACESIGIFIEEDKVNKEHMEYFGCIPSTREYNVHRITYFVPAGVSVKSIWRIIFKELHKNRRKHLVFQHQDFA